VVEHLLYKWEALPSPTKKTLNTYVCICVCIFLLCSLKGDGYICKRQELRISVTTSLNKDGIPDIIILKV
jgi:hypothetical protein